MFSSTAGIFVVSLLGSLLSIPAEQARTLAGELGADGASGKKPLLEPSALPWPLYREMIQRH